MVGAIPISNLPYADDAALLKTSVEDIERLATAIDVTGKDLNLKLNVKKTKLAQAEGKEYNITIDREEVEQVNHFKYLGSVKTSNANCTAGGKARIGMAKGRMIELQDLRSDRNLATELKMKVINILVWSVLLHGLGGLD
ncbi:uncharacterized protein [Amphiura filiformis]|uniref:uncharacterized protein n=1 Tax=Amphiura filiformis TaxID=82378 RepID=UPI003B218C96